MPKRLLWLVLPLVAVSAPPVVYNAKDWWNQAKQRVTPLLALGTGPESAKSTLTVPGSSRKSRMAGDQ